jgi:DHA2 family multidrug resistance protein
VSATAISANGPTAYAPPERGTEAFRRLNIGFFGMVIGMFMAILDIQIVASSIQQIQAGVAASADEITWIQTSYLIAEVIGIPLSGLLNRAFGMKRLWLYSALGFVGSSALCAVAWNLESLVFFRCIQGFLGAAMIPTTMAAAFTLFGQNRSTLQQVAIGMVATLAPSIGPTLGGWLTDHISWHWLFLVNVGPGLLAAYMVANYIPASPRDVSLIRNIDFIGLGAMGLFLGSFEWIFEEGPKAGWLQDENLVMWMIICAVAGAFFFWRALTRKNPVVDLSVFQNRNFAVGSLVATLVGFGLFGSVFLTPLFLGQVRGFSSIQIGEIMSVGGMAMFIAGPLTGVIIRKVDPRIVLTVGLCITGTGLYLNQFLTVQSSYWELFLPQALRGAGLIMCMLPSNFLALGTLPPMKLPNATGLVTVCRNLGGAVGLAALNTMRLTYNNMHVQEIGAGMDPTQPEVAAYVAAQEQHLRVLGATDAHHQAMAALARRAAMEAQVITFNNLFLVMSICFISLLAIVPLIKLPKAVAPGGAPRPEAH